MSRPAASSPRLPSSAVLLVGALGALGALAACSRTPPEPAPAASTGTADPRSAGDPVTPRAAAVPLAGSGSPNTKPASARCIAATPAEAQPIPPAASPSACPPDPEGIPKLNTAQVGFPEAAGNPKVDVELVSSEREIERGLMYRMSMPEQHGMLFRLGDRRDHTFWMHNTCMALDMLFVDDDGMIVGIVEGATPLTDSTRSVGCPSSFVLEVNAGWCRRHGVKAGQKMGIPPAAR